MNSKEFLTQCQLAEEYAHFVQEEFVETMRARGHEIEIYGDEIMVRTV